MTYWPEPSLLPTHQLTISTFGAAGAYGTIGTGVNPSSGGISTAANFCLAWPFRLTRPMTYQTAWWMNGATVLGNIIVGIYGAPPGNPTDSQPVKLAETASTAQAGTNAIQSTSIGPIYLRPGIYYIALIKSTNSTQTFFRTGSNTVVEEDRHLGGWRINQGSFALPTTLGTPTSASNTMDPLFGIAAQTVI